MRYTAAAAAAAAADHHCFMRCSVVVVVVNKNPIRGTLKQLTELLRYANVDCYWRLCARPMNWWTFRLRGWTKIFIMIIIGT